MARTGVTVDQVASAALAIKVRGSDPTISAVRVELGNVGSYSTISQHLATWRARPVEQVDQRPMPPEVEQHALQLAASLWTAAVRQADHAADAAREQAEDCRRRCDAEVAEARAEIEGLEARVDQLDASVVQLDGQVNYQRERAENISVRRDDATRERYRSARGRISIGHCDGARRRGGLQSQRRRAIRRYGPPPRDCARTLGLSDGRCQHWNDGETPAVGRRVFHVCQSRIG